MTWLTKKLREIAEIYSGGRGGITKKDYVERGFPAFSAAGQDGFTKEAHDSGFAVILSSIGSRCGKCFYAEGKWTALANTQIIKFENPVTAKFMYYYLNDANKWPKSGTGQPFISPSVVKNLIVPFPPLPIQRKIVKILDTIQSAVKIQEKIIEKTKELKKSLMNLLFHYGLAGLRVKELVSSRVHELTSSGIEKLGLKLKKTEIGEIPEDWEVVRLGEVCNTATGGTPSRSKEDYFNGNILWVKSGEIDDNIIFDTEEKITEEGLNKSSARIFPKNTLLIAMYGATAGKTALLGKEASINQAVCAILPKSQKININFLRYFIIQFREKLLSERYGGAQPNLNQFIIQNFKIFLPSLPEQREIAEILQTIDQKIEIEKKKKELYEELFKTMLNKIMGQEIDIGKIEI
jgi:type I restriction enzyme S subunit